MNFQIWSEIIRKFNCQTLNKDVKWLKNEVNLIELQIVSDGWLDGVEKKELILRSIRLLIYLMNFSS